LGDQCNDRDCTFFLPIFFLLANVRCFLSFLLWVGGVLVSFVCFPLFLDPPCVTARFACAILFLCDPRVDLFLQRHQPWRHYNDPRFSRLSNSMIGTALLWCTRFPAARSHMAHCYTMSLRPRTDCYPAQGELLKVSSANALPFSL
jgi:hypothetical protein